MRIKMAFCFFLLPLGIFSTELEGMASWYGPKFHGKLTANGEIFNTFSFTAAHKSLPLNSIVKVTSLENNREIIVRINDRGPFAKGRIIDLSKAAAVRLDMLKKGVMPVKLEVLKLGDNRYYRYTSNRYQIQVASFKEEKKAEILKRKLQKQGISAVITKSFVKGAVFYRVEVHNLTYGMLHTHKLSLHEIGIHDYLIKKGRS